MTVKTRPYGNWISPISAEMVAQSGTGHGALPKEIRTDGPDVYWSEQRSEESGRDVIVKLQDDYSREIVTPDGFSVRSRVHEYGGGAYCVRNGTIIFVNAHDQRLYRQDPGESPFPITPDYGDGRSHRYADGTFMPDGNATVWVRERHAENGEIHNEIVLIPADGSGEPRVLVSGHDFFSNPRLSPDGKSLAWLCWDHPRMPWDGTELWVTSFNPETQQIGNMSKIAGDAGISIFQPEWSPDGVLHFVSDQSGWSNIYSVNRDGIVKNLYPIDAEFGYPQWLFGFTTYTFLSTNLILAAYKIKGQAHLGLINIEGKILNEIAATFTTFENPSIYAAEDQSAWFFAGSSLHPPALWRYQAETNSARKVLDIFEPEIKPEDISEPEQIEFDNGRGSSTFAYFYPPKNQHFQALPDEKPPLIVMSHGGPTASALPHLDLETQYWTTRGFAVVDVDYSGSVGYGRAYRERLNGEMGKVDVEDCVQSALYLSEKGMVDPERLIIRGSSAGGYVTLCAVTFYDLFAAGASYYGVSDLEALAKHTHKFEAHYLDTLVGPYPQEKDLYFRRSPINFTEQLDCPMILLQGLEDTIVPPHQSEQMVAELDAKGIPYKYVTYENESHGFDRFETIKDALGNELHFYRSILEFPGDKNSNR